MSVLGENDAALVKQLDAGLKCSWNWSWLKLEGKVSVKGQEVSFYLGDVFNKVNRQGFARCVLCHKYINYANKGSHALQAHCQTEIHKKKVEMIASTHSVASTVLPASSSRNPVSQSQASQGPETIRQQCQGKIPVPVKNRIANSESSCPDLFLPTGSPYLAPCLLQSPRSSKHLSLVCLALSICLDSLLCLLLQYSVS
ncbi:hypothetical protein QQF64_035893 [Cirrhinus molitorella]|uniref:BED-type domain-containing protein n=1 Tax=Cirrhinus molitorella TaxID=172907 RepID=A0ABR3NH15_9TELE